MSMWNAATYNRLSEILADDAVEPESAEWLADAMADLFAQDNPRFDRERWLEACEVGWVNCALCGKATAQATDRMLCRECAKVGQP